MNHRQTIRLCGYDYTREGVYFVTICAHRHKGVFGNVVDGEVCLDTFGRIVSDEWIGSAKIRTEVCMDVRLVTPDHVHVVILPPDADPAVDYSDPHGYRMDVWNRPSGSTGLPGRGVGATGRSPLRGPPPRSLGAMMAGYKCAATKRINRVRGTPGAPVWTSKCPVGRGLTLPPPLND